MGLDNGGENVKDISHHSISIHFIFIWVNAYSRTNRHRTAS